MGRGITLTDWKDFGGTSKRKLGITLSGLPGYLADYVRRYNHRADPEWVKIYRKSSRYWRESRGSKGTLTF